MKGFLLFLLLLSLLACRPVDLPDPAPEPGVPEMPATSGASLKQVSTFPIGLATQNSKFADPSYSRLVELEFNSLTPEYEMNQHILHTGPYSYNWTLADKLVNYAKVRNIRVHGHALIWNKTIPEWLQNFSGSDAAFSRIVKTYIQETVGRYGPEVASWDVVNEALGDGESWRNSLFRQRMGEDYIAKCFQYAHEADSTKLLFYNDFGTTWNSGKLKTLLEMIDDFQARGIPIHGIGFQMHITYDWPTLSQIETAVNAVVSRGLMVHFSEIDVRINPEGTLHMLSEARAMIQMERIRKLTELYLEIPPNQQFGMTFWGLRDNESWLIDYWGNPEWPLLFDEFYQRKLAHKGFIEAF